jgi:hypothetical protein
MQPADPMAPAVAARRRRRTGLRIAIGGHLAVLLLVTAAGTAGAGCPPPTDGAPDGEVATGCTVDQPEAPAAAAATPAEDGKRELLLARQLLDEGESASDDAGRRKAYEAAKQHADRAVELLPESADARFVQFGADGRLAQLGGIAVAALQLVKLNNQLDEVLRLDPNHANALAARGGMLMKLPRLFGGNTTKGVEYLERAVALDDTAVGKRLELAEAYHIVGREDDAKAMAQNALETAKRLDEPERVATCERFITELQKTCDGCAVATIGR